MKDLGQAYDDAVNKYCKEMNEDELRGFMRGYIEGTLNSINSDLHYIDVSNIEPYVDYVVLTNKGITIGKYMASQSQWLLRLNDRNVKVIGYIEIPNEQLLV